MTLFECYADLYLLTGNATYLNAVLGGWEMFRDPLNGWMFPGGSFAINENYVYRPGSFPLEHAGSSGTRPTGELCPSAFWVHLNRRLHDLDPDNETFVWEQERSIINVGIAGRADGGVRYFAVLHHTKATPDFTGTCCESQSARLFGTTPSLVFSVLTDGGGAYVNLFEPATLATITAAGVAVNVTIVTAWPLDSLVSVLVTAASDVPAGGFDLALRMPAWLDGGGAAASVPVAVDGQAYAKQGSAATYLHVDDLAFVAGVPTNVSYRVPMGWQAHAYTGETQITGFSRYAYTLGPFLMAALGPWNAALDVVVVNGTASGGALDPLDPSAWLEPTAEPLVFAVRGQPGLTVEAYYALGTDDVMDVFPVVIAA